MELEESVAKSPSNSSSRPRWWRSMLSVLSRPQFITGAIVPVVIFYVLRRMGYPLAGATLAGLWGLGVALGEYFRTRRLNIFGAMAAVLAAITVVTTLIAQDEAFYLASDAIGDVLSATIFLASLLLPRSLMQIIVEESGLTHFPEVLRRIPRYRRAWQIVTAAWGAAYIVKAVLLLLLQFGPLAQGSISIESFLAIRTVAGWAAALGMMAFAFWFPNQYWRHRSDI